MRTAPQILQLYLDEVAASVMRDDYAFYRSRVSLPFQLVTHAASLHITTEDELRQGFVTFAGTLRIQRVTDYLRLVEGGEFLDDALITGRYITHMMAGAHRILAPFRSSITLRLEGGIWRGASITNALANSRWPLLIATLPETPAPKGTDDA
ncbi:MAG: hypothetical protein ACK4GO_14525 [Gemmobacter sp.]